MQTLELDEQQRKTHRIVSNEEEDDDEVGDGEEKIRFLQEQLNRSKLKRDLLEREALEFLIGIDREILVQYLTSGQFQQIFQKREEKQQHQTISSSASSGNPFHHHHHHHSQRLDSLETSEIDHEFENILQDLLAKLKDDLRNVNKTLDLQQHHQNHHNHHRKQQHQQQYLVEQQASPELILEQQRKALRALRTNDAEPYESFI